MARLPSAAWLATSVILLSTTLLLGCLRKDYPPQPVVSQITLQGQQSADTRGLLSGLATVESPRFLGIWDGVAFEYEVYDPDLLAKDLQRVERYLHAKGYYEAKVVAARVIPEDAHRVRVEIRITEGAPVLTRSVTPRGLETLSIDVATDALRGNLVSVGSPFDEGDYAASKKNMVTAMRNAGYAFAKVEGQAVVDVANHTADVTYQVRPGPMTRYGEISIVGLDEVPRSKVEAVLDLVPGERYSQADVDDARRAVGALGVFSSVAVGIEEGSPEAEQVPIVVRVEEARLRTVRAGGGVELDALKLATHATVGWEDRNFLGGVRRFSIDAKPGLIYYPTRFGNLQAPDRALFTQELKARLHQPAMFEGRTAGFVSSSFSVQPLLYSDGDPDEGIVGFSELKASTGLERAFWEHHLFVTSSYNWQLELPVDYSQLTLGRGIAADDELLEDLVIAFPEIVANLDFRDDRLNPTQGALLSVNLQTAAKFFGSDVSDTRVRPEARFYVPISKSVTFATRFATGFLFTNNYGDTLGEDEAQFSDAELARDQQKLLFRGFFSGGPNSNRGYPLREVGPHGNVRFLTRNVDCVAAPASFTCNRPLGGVTLWEASAEVRFPIASALRGVTFLDGSDVGRDLTLSFLAPHLSAGMGLRYATPIGPVRLDVGYRLQFAQDFGEGPYDPEPGDILGLPIAIHLTLGEAF